MPNPVGIFKVNKSFGKGFKIGLNLNLIQPGLNKLSGILSQRAASSQIEVNVTRKGLELSNGEKLGFSFVSRGLRQSGVENIILQQASGDDIKNSIVAAMSKKPLDAISALKQLNMEIKIEGDAFEDIFIKEQQVQALFSVWGNRKEFVSLAPNERFDAQQYYEANIEGTRLAGFMKVLKYLEVGGGVIGGGAGASFLAGLLVMHFGGIQYLESIEYLSAALGGLGSGFASKSGLNLLGKDALKTIDDIMNLGRLVKKADLMIRQIGSLRVLDKVNQDNPAALFDALDQASPLLEKLSEDKIGTLLGYWVVRGEEKKVSSILDKFSEIKRSAVINHSVLAVDQANLALQAEAKGVLKKLVISASDKVLSQIYASFINNNKRQYIPQVFGALSADLKMKLFINAFELLSTDDAVLFLQTMDFSQIKTALESILDKLKNRENDDIVKFLNYLDQKDLPEVVATLIKDNMGNAPKLLIKFDAKSTKTIFVSDLINEADTLILLEDINRGDFDYFNSLMDCFYADNSKDGKLSELSAKGIHEVNAYVSRKLVDLGGDLVKSHMRKKGEITDLIYGRVGGRKKLYSPDGKSILEELAQIRIREEQLKGEVRFFKRTGKYLDWEKIVDLEKFTGATKYDIAMYILIRDRFYPELLESQEVDPDRGVFSPCLEIISHLDNRFKTGVEEVVRIFNADRREKMAAQITDKKFDLEPGESDEKDPKLGRRYALGYVFDYYLDLLYKRVEQVTLNRLRYELPKVQLCIGVTIDGRYRLEERAGKGSFASVFKVWDQQAKEFRAMKFLDLRKLRPFDHRDHLAKFFQKEIDIMKKLDHPNIVKYFGDGKETEEVYYFVLEYVKGKLLRQYFELNPNLPDSATINSTYKRWFKEICGAVDHMHGKTVNHYDLTTSNLMLTDANLIIKIIDFGISKAADVYDPDLEKVAGITPGFGSPEQWDGIGDCRSDIYSLGVLFDFMLTRRSHLFMGSDKTIVQHKYARKVQGIDVPALDRPRSRNRSIPNYIDDAIWWALEPDPKKRPQTVEEFRRALKLD